MTAIGCAANPMVSNDNIPGDAGSSGDASTSGDAGTSTGGPRPAFTRGVSTLAGYADPGYLDGNRDVNLFHNPVNVAYAGNGKLYVADFDNNKLRVVDRTGVTTTVVTPITFARPFGMAVDAEGALYVSTDNDQNNAHSLTS